MSTVVSAVVSGGLIVGFERYYDLRAERRQTTQDFVMLFHSSVYADHRDRLARFVYEPRMAALLEGRDVVTGESRSFDSLREWNEDYTQRLVALAEEHEEILISTEALLDFFQSVASCIDEDRCSEYGTVTAIGHYARSFHGTFFPLIRYIDCRTGQRSLEFAVLKLVEAPVAFGFGCDVFEASI